MSRLTFTQTRGSGKPPEMPEDKMPGKTGRVSLVTPGLAIVGLAIVLAANARLLTGESTSTKASGSQPEIRGKAQGYVSTIAFSGDGKWLAVGSSADEEIALWQVAPGGREITLGDATSSVFCLAFAQSGKRVASAHADGRVFLWDLASGEVLARLQPAQGIARTLAFSPDGQQLAVGTTQGEVLLWNLEQLNSPSNVLLGRGSVNSLAYSPDGHRLATGQTNSTVQLWDLDRCELISTIATPTDSVTAVRFSPDGQILASTSPLDWKIRLWDGVTGKPQGELSGGESGPASSLAFSPDGQALACGGSRGVISVWDFKNHRVVNELRGHEGYVWALVFSPDGERLVSGGDDKTVRLWDWTQQSKRDDRG